MQNTQLAKKIKEVLLKAGFSGVSFLRAEHLADEEQRFLDWRASGKAAGMTYLKRAQPINARPQNLIKDAKTLIVMTADYARPQNFNSDLFDSDGIEEADLGRIAAYAAGKDYHKVLKKKIKCLLEENQDLKQMLAQARFFTDAVPLLEKAYATRAKLGFIGKNSLLISKQSGSYKFIAEFITDLELPIVHTRTDDGNVENLHMASCANCIRCKEICPTGALDETYQVDARKCLSYWNIEQPNLIPFELASRMGNWLFGCDLCQLVCPYNRKIDSLRPSYFEEFAYKNTSLELGENIWQPLILILFLEPSLILELNEFLELSSVVTNSLIINLKSKESLCVNDELKNYARKFKNYANKLNLALKQCLKSFASLLGQDEEAFYDQIFYQIYGSSPVSRAKRVGLVRSALIVSANNRNQILKPFVSKIAKLTRNPMLRTSAEQALKIYDGS